MCACVCDRVFVRVCVRVCVCVRVPRGGKIDVPLQYFLDVDKFIVFLFDKTI